MDINLNHLVTSDSSVASSKGFIGAVEDEWQLFSDCEEDYTIGLPIGFGASSIVYSATYQQRASSLSVSHPCSISCALKVLDLDVLPPRSLALLQRETSLMSLSKHPNVLRVRGSWMKGHKLYIALRLMNKGSAADIMRYGWLRGMPEDVILCVLRQALEGLNYLHINGFIHRDIKGANLLVDNDGTVLLGDLGVAADLSEDTSLHIPVTTVSLMSASSSFTQSDIQSSGGTAATSKRIVVFDHTNTAQDRPRVGKRKSFVGTPCWMAPELIQGHQYDSSADIWSFGITALELSQGRPPKSKDTPQRVLLRTIQDDPPTVDRLGGAFKYSRSFKEVVDWCLNKDPSNRPSAQELLLTNLFKNAKKKSFLVGTILKDLPPLAVRQERRAVKHTHTSLTFDSWDFTTTHHSPKIDAHLFRISKDFALQSEKSIVHSVPETRNEHELTKSVSLANIPVARTKKEPLNILSHSNGDAVVPGFLLNSTSVDLKSKSQFVESAEDGDSNQRSSAAAPQVKALLSFSQIPLRTSTGTDAVSTTFSYSGLWNRLKFNVRHQTSRNSSLAHSYGSSV